MLIVRLGAFGDIVHTLPLAAALHAAGHEVGWLCEDRWACLLDGSPAIARIHALPRRQLRAGTLRERWAACRKLHAQLLNVHYEVVLDAQGLAKSALCALMSGAPRRYGHAWPRAREGAWLVLQRACPPRAVHVIDQQCALVETLGLAPPSAWRFPLPPWEAERAWARAWLAERGLERAWMCNVGAGWPTKVWPPERWSELLLRCRDRPRLVLWGTASEREVAERVAAASGAALAPPTTIPQLAGLLAQAAVLVSGDTGPLHLAFALGTPAVGLFGPVPAARNGPRGARWRNLQAPGAAWERRERRRVDMAAITVEAVLAAIAEVAA